MVVAPILRDIAILSPRYPLSRYTFSGSLAVPQNGMIPPPRYLVSHRRICATPRFATFRAISIRYPVKTSTIHLVGKCSATRYSVAAPPPGARHGLGGPMHPRHSLRWQRERCDRGLWEGCSCDTPATHSELRNEPRQGCSYTVERDRGGCSICLTKSTKEVGDTIARCG